MDIVNVALEFVVMIGVLALLVGFCIILGGAKIEPLEESEVLRLMNLGQSSDIHLVMDKNGHSALGSKCGSNVVTFVFRLGLFPIVKRAPSTQLRVRRDGAELQLGLAGQPRSFVRRPMNDPDATSFMSSIVHGASA